MTENKNDEIETLFGVSKESIEKSKNIYPTLELGKLEENSIVFGVVCEEKPNNVKHKNKFKKKGEPEELETPVLIVFVDTIKRRTSDGEIVELPIQEKQSLWLSSKSLSLGFAKLYEENSRNLKDIGFKITISTADYKEYGENTCYRVSKFDLKKEQETD